MTGVGTEFKEFQGSSYNGKPREFYCELTVKCDVDLFSKVVSPQHFFS